MQGVLHLVEVKEFSDDLGAEQAILIRYNLLCYCCRKLTLLQVFASATKTLFLLFLEDSDDL